MGLSVEEAFIQAEEQRSKLSISDAGSIPVIDLSPLVAADGIEHSREVLSGLVAKVGDACKEWGFFQVVNHGVPAELHDRVHAVAREFFALPLEEKRRVRHSEESPTGYYDTERTKNVRDWKEVFDFVANEPIRMPATAEPGEERIDSFWNQWPANPPDLRDVCERYAKEMEKLAFKLLELISLSLGLHAKRLTEFFREHSSFLRLNYYPPCPNPDLALGVGPHTDPGLLTILSQDDVGGLDVRRKSDGEWVRVKSIPNAYVINLGEMAQVWSNDAYESVEHRVTVNCTRGRFSIPFFLTPAHHVNMRPLEELLGGGSPARYEEYNCGKFMKERYNSNFKKLQEDNIQITSYRKVL